MPKNVPTYPQRARQPDRQKSIQSRVITALSKDGESTVFTGVCLFTRGGGPGTPVPGSFPGLWLLLSFFLAPAMVFVYTWIREKLYFHLIFRLFVKHL